MEFKISAISAMLFLASLAALGYASEYWGDVPAYVSFPLAALFVAWIVGSFLGILIPLLCWLDDQ